MKDGIARVYVLDDAMSGELLLGFVRKFWNRARVPTVELVIGGLVDTTYCQYMTIPGSTVLRVSISLILLFLRP